MPLGALLARVHACASTVCACRVLCVRTPRERMSVYATGGRHMASRSLDRTRRRGGMQDVFLLLARHVMSARSQLLTAKSDSIRRQDVRKVQSARGDILTTRQAKIEQKVQSASQKTPAKDNLVQGAASRVRQARTAWADLRDNSDNDDYDDYA